MTGSVPENRARLLAIAVGQANVETGARLEFLGVVRATEGVRTIRGIRYSAYEAMAAAELEKIAKETASRPGIGKVEVEHLLGLVSVGEWSLRLVVEGKHSAETIDALQGCLAAVKRKVPVWKEFVE